ncbi:MAG TPA: DUF1993 domain-containing protein [Alphaproteobacteria bacterium]|nr:DUF1993 domain-containing protein [Alphaproteobacteria bacterium]
MYQASIPVFRQKLDCLATLLKKAEAHAAEKKIDPSVLLQARLFPDMFPLVKQVQIAADTAKGGAANLAGIEAPRFEDVEVTFPELSDRIQRTQRYLDQFRPEQIDGAEDKDINLVLGGHQVGFKGRQYLLGFVTPNFYFHLTTAYAILRHSGVEVGKRDFLGAF